MKKDKTPYIHDPNLKYPDTDFVHMIETPKYFDYNYDKDFPYRLKDKKSKFMKFLFHVVILLIVKPFVYFRYLLIVEGKKNYRTYRKLAKRKAMITISNHTTEWDSLMVMTSRFFHFFEFPMWQEGAEGKSGFFYRYAGGIVLPTSSYKGMQYAYEAMREVVKEDKWLHVFPEAACWAFYPAIRKFGIGTFKLAVEENLPILPMVVKYRKPNIVWRIFKKHPNAKLIIGEPVVPDTTLDIKERINDLHDRCRNEMMSLLGLDEHSNEELRKSLPTYHAEKKSLFN